MNLPLGIRGRLTLWFALGAIGAVVFGSTVVYLSGVTAIQATLGQTYCQIASRAAGQFEIQFAQATSAIRNLATDVLTAGVAMEESEAYRQRDDEWIAARLTRLEAQWRAANGPDERKALLHAQLSQRLTVLAGLGHGAATSFAVYDLHGGLLAASRPPPARVATDAPWFVATARQTRHFTYVDLDERSRLLLVVVPVWGGVEIVGLLVAEYDYRSFAAGVEDVRFGSTGEALVVRADGLPLIGPQRSFLPPALAGADAHSHAPVAESKAPVQPFWVTVPDGAESRFWRRLACVVPLVSTNTLRTRFGLPDWSVVVTQSPDESYAALKTSLMSFLAAGIIGIVVVGGGGAFIAWRIAMPLAKLHEGVRRFATGQRESPAEVVSTDEIGELAREFNRMAERVTASENELRAFAQAVNGAADAIIMTDTHGTIYYANPAFEAVTGYRADEVKGTRAAFVGPFVSAPDVPMDADVEMRRAVEQGRPWRGELWNRRKNGEVYPVELTISPVHDEHGNVVSLLAVYRDITLARQYQESLKKEVAARTRQISETQGLTVMGRMASMIAHDLRNALSTIKMNLQILNRRHSETGDSSEEHCKMGLGQVRYMEEILRDMLSFARPERLRTDWHDPVKIVDEALAGGAHLVEEHHVRVIRDDSKGLPTVYCDRVKVLEALGNLINNAIQAMPAGGELAVSSQLVIDSPSPFVRLAVSDSGEGIPPDVLPNVFEPFFTTRAKGTGLGLSIVKRIIEQHSGQVDIRTKPGLGTTVAFTLPTAPIGQ